MADRQPRICPSYKKECEKIYKVVIITPEIKSDLAKFLRNAFPYFGEYCMLSTENNYLFQTYMNFNHFVGDLISSGCSKLTKYLY